jgi:renalase
VSGAAPAVVVVGAGIAGAAAAAELVRAGVPTRVLDRGRLPGGRLVGLPVDGRVCDVGAQYFTVSDPGFAAVVADWSRRGLAREWTDTFHVAGPEGLRSQTTGPMRYGTTGGLGSLVADLLAGAGVAVTSEHEVRRIGRAHGTPELLPTVDGEPAAAIALAAPGPQARRLLDPTEPALEGVHRAAEGVFWEPVVAVALGYEARTWEAFDGVFVNEDEVLSWVADDGRRRGDGAPVLVAHVIPAYSAAHLGDPEAVLPAVLAALRRILGITAAPRWEQVQLWSYARPARAWASPFHFDPLTRIGLAGDGWAGGPRIESAWISGQALGIELSRFLGDA